MSINGAQSVRLEKGTIEFKNLFIQILVPSKIYSDFECVLNSAESCKGFCSKNIKIAFLLVLLTNLFVLFINLVNQFCLQRWKCCKRKSMNTVEKWWKKISTKTGSWLKKNNFNGVTFVGFVKNSLNEDEKFRDNCHVTERFRDAAHWSCNINLQLTKKVSVIFHNLRGYDSHVVLYELKKFDVKVDVIPNRLEKYMALMINKNLVFIDSMQVMN